jgi:hypothetical protein
MMSFWSKPETLSSPPESIVVPVATPPSRRSKVPPLTVVPILRPAPFSWPPESMIVLLAVPPDETSRVPPLATVVSIAVPPVETLAVSPLWTIIIALSGRPRHARAPMAPSK